MKTAFAVVLFAVTVPVWASDIAVPSGIQPAKRVVNEQPAQPKIVVAKPAVEQKQKNDNNVKAATKAPEVSVGPTIMN